MKLEIFEKQAVKQEKSYPKLMMNEHGAIALMFSLGKGVLLRSADKDTKAPQYFSCFATGETSSYKDYDGSVTLRND